MDNTVALSSYRSCLFVKSPTLSYLLYWQCNISILFLETVANTCRLRKASVVRV